MENDQEIVTQENDTDLTVQEEVVEEATEQPQEDVEDLKKRLATAEAQKDHWRKKATEKKETVVEKAETGVLSSADLLAVMNAKVHEDDMERVEKFAKMEGKSIREALKDPELKAILALREEQRNTANASNTANVRRGSTKVPDDVLVANARAGKLPENDDDIARLIEAKSRKK